MFNTLRKGMQAARKIPMLNLFAALMMMFLTLSALPVTAQAALLDFGPIVPEVIGSTPPNIGHGYPAWFRDTNRVPLQLCLDEVGGCLFLAADRPDLTQPLAFPNLPDELFYYSATATLGAQNEHLLFAGVEMNLVDNGDGTYDQVGFSRVRIRIDTLVAGDYIITTPWKQYFFHVSQADIDATVDGRRVINATEDIGLGPDGEFAGVLKGNIGPYVYSVGAPFGIAPNLYLGTGAPLPVTGSTFTDPVTGQPANIFRIQGPNGFATVSTSQFAVTGKLYLDPIPTPITVDRATYVRNATETRVNGFATTLALSNQVNAALPFPQNFALTGAPSVLQVSGAGTPTTLMTTNGPADGKFFSDSGLFANPGSLPVTVAVTNTADTPNTVQPAPLVDEVVISQASYAPATRTLSVAATSGDTLTPPPLRLFFPGEPLPAGTLASGQVSVTFPITLGGKTYEIPPAIVTVASSLGGSDAEAVSVPMAPALPTITSAAGPNGGISPAGATAVATGGSQTYTITPNPGFQVASLVVDGVTIPATTSYTFVNVTGNHTISATFAASPVITAAAGPNGTISPAGATSPALGANQTYTITPNAGFMVVALSVDGVVLPAATSYTFTNVTASHAINAYFEAIPATVTITAAASPGGTISPAGVNSVAGGSSPVFTITPDPLFMVTALSVDGVALPAATSYTFTNVIADHAISAYFAPVPATVTITASAGLGGTISPAGVNSVAGGSSPVFTITPDAGLAIVALVVDGVVLPAAPTFTFTNVSADHYINAYFQ